jgi:hypothetical protein
MSLMLELLSYAVAAVACIAFVIVMGLAFND